MTRIDGYLDELFSDCPEDRRMTARRKALGERLEKRYAELRGTGMDEEEAFRRTLEGLPSAQALTGRVQRIDSEGYRLEMTQIGLMYCVIGWVVSMPMRLFGSMVYVNEIMMLTGIAVGVYYLMLHLRKKPEGLKETRKVEREKLVKRSRIVWLVWAVLALAWLVVFFVFFAGDVSAAFTKFYSAGLLLSEALAPLLTVFVPLLCTDAARLTDRYEVTA